jgi:maleylacetoacetate isomerase
MSRLVLHSFHSSSTSFRVRIALRLKGLEFDYVPVALRWENGDHDTDEFRAFNPQRNLPVLVDGNVRLTQSLAIIDYLDRKHPEPPLHPAEPAARGRVLSLALHLACEVQPLNNLRVQRYLRGTLAIDEAAFSTWSRHWTSIGFDAVEAELARGGTGLYCHGDRPSVADCCLVPQVYNSQRPVVGLDLARWPTIRRIYERCLGEPAFEQSLPKNQPDWAEISGH